MTELDSNSNSLQINLLDHGHVRLVDHMGSDLSIVRAARVSYNADWRAGLDEKSDTKLINYLYQNHHLTPFETVIFTFEICAPIFVFRQWHRHRTQSYNEVSARYTELPEVYYLPDPNLVGKQALKNKQGRDITKLSPEQYIDVQNQIQLADLAMANSYMVYSKLLNAGWPRELARSVLPVATYSRMFTTMNLRNLFQFLTLRVDSHAQYEIRVYANAILQLISPIVPVAVAAWEKDLTK